LGHENINHSKPTILIANHNNQFIDGLVLITELEIPSGIKFVAAAKALSFPFIKSVLTSLGVVKVDRPQDQVKWREDFCVKEWENRAVNNDMRLCLICDKIVSGIEVGHYLMMQCITESMRVLQILEENGVTVIVFNENISASAIKDRYTKNKLKVLPITNRASI